MFCFTGGKMKQIELQKTAIYCRLSLDDGSEGDSSSIQTQKIMLEKYATEHGFVIHDYYVDDGYSELNYDRPAFKRMLDDIDKGLISVVITKDLSRLGRDYIQTGYYTDIYFSNKNVRYIAVNDNIDTLNDNNDIAPFKNILNDMYAKDISRKVKTAKRERMYKGYFIGCQPPYGYKVDPSDPKHLIVDEEVREVIELIYSLALTNIGVVKITYSLNDRHIDSPMVYKAKHGDKRAITQLNKRRESHSDEYLCKWNLNMVAKILKDPVYIGDMENHKYEIKNYKTKRRTPVAKDDRIIVKDTHEAIISRSDYHKVQELIKGRARPSKYDFPNIFKGILKCECGSTMTIGYHQRKSGKKVYSYQCYSKYLRNGKDNEANSIRYEVIYQIVDSKIKELFEKIKAKGEDYLLSMIQGTEEYDELSKLRKERDRITKRVETLTNLVSKVFEDYASGIILYQNYEAMMNKYQKEQKELTIKLKEIDNRLLDDLEKPQSKSKRFMEVAKRYIDYDELTKEMLNALIDHIVIGKIKEENGQKVRDISIVYRYLS